MATPVSQYTKTCRGIVLESVSRKELALCLPRADQIRYCLHGSLLFLRHTSQLLGLRVGGSLVDSVDRTGGPLLHPRRGTNILLPRNI